MPANIYIVGAQCTGKTTLVDALQKHFNVNQLHSSPGPSAPVLITELARTVLQQHKFTADDIVSSPSRSLEFQRLILDAQYEAELKIGNRWFISDRSGIDPIIYAKRYVGDVAARQLIESQAWSILKDSMRKSMIIVCQAGADWLFDDGVRLMPQDRDDWLAFHDLFCSSLDGESLSYFVLPNTLVDRQERVDFVLQHWAEMSQP
ncbi:hypothetical protein MMC28_006880 [Mycoblastus sanguinarius]|nr:hypothetical protein [Mycoblastus sanguinarius]